MSSPEHLPGDSAEGGARHGSPQQHVGKALCVVQQPLALIVDHGLRPGSAAEAAAVRAQAQGFGMQV